MTSPLHLPKVEQHIAAGGLWRVTCPCGFSALCRGRLAAQDAKDSHMEDVREEIYWSSLGTNTGEH